VTVTPYATLRRVVNRQKVRHWHEQQHRMGSQLKSRLEVRAGSEQNQIQRLSSGSRGVRQTTGKSDQLRSNTGRQAGYKDNA